MIDHKWPHLRLRVLFFVAESSLLPESRTSQLPARDPMCTWSPYSGFSDRRDVGTWYWRVPLASDRSCSAWCRCTPDGVCLRRSRRKSNDQQKFGDAPAGQLPRVDHAATDYSDFWFAIWMTRGDSNRRFAWRRLARSARARISTK
jgi:hypothetical protein